MGLDRQRDLDIHITERSEQDEWDIPTRIFEVKKGNEIAAKAEVKLISSPMPLVYLHWMSVSGLDKGLMSKGYGSVLMDRVEDLIRKEGKLGLLYDKIMMSPAEAHGMYERRGWKVVPERSSLMYFNAGPNAPLDQLSRIYDQGIEFIYYRGERGLVDIS